jgi:nitrite reductase/ring-hydroxylating ferredoxin subunit
MSDRAAISDRIAMPDRFPPGGFPEGWYAIRPSCQLAPKQVEGVRYFGRDMVLYRTAGGSPHLVESVCPHMGGNLALGRVDGEHLVCGMHGFEFGGDGRCVKLAYGTNPPFGARLVHYPVQEINGYVFGYYSRDASHPTWKLEPLDWKGWTPLHHQRHEFAGHPQETTENSVDLGHFNSIHLYTTSVDEQPVTVGEKLTSSYGLVRPWFGRRLQRIHFSVRFDVLAHGLGYSVVHASVLRTPISIRYFINATPIDGERIHLNIAAAIRKLRVPIPGLNRLVRRAVFEGFRHDVSQDIPFWESKRYIERPLLAVGDGPIAIYRRWCRQFYSESEIVES